MRTICASLVLAYPSVIHRHSLFLFVHVKIGVEVRVRVKRSAPPAGFVAMRSYSVLNRSNVRRGRRQSEGASYRA